MSRQCDAFKCPATVATGRFLCSRHWRLVPTSIQQTINTRYRAGRKDAAFLSDAAYLQACVDAINHLAKGDGHTQGEGIGDSSSYGRLLRIAQGKADAVKLKSCPFCGGSARQSVGGDGPDRRFGTGCAALLCPATLFALVHCTQEDADASWNNRSDTAK